MPRGRDTDASSVDNGASSVWPEGRRKMKDDAGYEAGPEIGRVALDTFHGRNSVQERRTDTQGEVLGRGDGDDRR